MTSTIKLYAYLGAAACIAIVIGLIYFKGVHDRGASDKIDTLTETNAGLSKRVEESGIVFGQVGARIDAMAAGAQARTALSELRQNYLETIQAEVEDDAKGNGYCGAGRRDFELWNALAQPAAGFKSGAATGGVSGDRPGSAGEKETAGATGAR